MAMKMRLDSIISLCAGILALSILALHIWIPANASEEYIYTIGLVFQICFLPLCLAAIVFSRAARGLLRGCKNSRFSLPVLFAAGIIFIAIPAFFPEAVYLEPFWKNMLSLCWICGSLSLTLALFILAAKIDSALSGLLCLLASILLFFGLAEIYFLSTEQFQDSYVQASKNSKYVLAGQAQAKLDLKKNEKYVLPIKPAHPSGAVAHREEYRQKPLYDVRYVFDDNNRRAMPKVSETPEADVLLFGCSFTFGYGLENEETWAWKLSEDLGPLWRVTNYAFYAFGPHEMLDMLEDNVVEKPTAPFRQALFLAISGHLVRPTGLFDMFSSRYVLKDGIAARDGVITDSPYYLVNSLPKLLNGSQTAREIGNRARKFIRDKKHDEFLLINASLIEQSAKLLQEKYDTPLTVLVWPDFDELLPELAKRGVNALAMRKFLPHWDEPDGSNYHIVKNCEFHPNQQAASEMAAGLAAWLRQRFEARPDAQSDKP